MKEIVIISGKGGTGKTSLTASFAALASRKGTIVLADCDVDAADLHLVLAPTIQETHEFISGKTAKSVPGNAGNWKKYANLCRFGAIRASDSGGVLIDEYSCEGCGVCAYFCDDDSIVFEDRRCGDWYVSDTRFGTLVHAALDIRAENSGKLVSTVRAEAKKQALEKGADFLLVDGSPGIGCPVIASITGANYVVIITEPTLSGQHDLERVASLARHFSIPFSVCMNKADINREEAERTRCWCERNEVPFLGMIPFDTSVTQAQIGALSVIELGASPAASAITNIWEKICQLNQ